MESTEASVMPWEWHDEVLADLNVDSDLSFATSHTLWEDLTQSEAGLTPLFESTPTSEFKHSRLHDLSRDKAEPSSSEDCMMMREDSPCLKRRRMLQFPCEQAQLNSLTPSMELASDPLDSYGDSYVSEYTDLPMHDVKGGNSMWYMMDDGSMSSIDDANEQLSMGDGEAHPRRWEGRCIAAEREEQHQMNTESPSSNGIPDFRVGNNGGSTAPFEIPMTALSGGGGRRLLAAYPFAVLKLSGMQGDVTLHDINQRINRPRRRSLSAGSSPPPNHHLPPGGSGGGGGQHPRSVLALTKIHTQGNGTITIMRTKN